MGRETNPDTGNRSPESTMAPSLSLSSLLRWSGEERETREKREEETGRKAKLATTRKERAQRL
jgi:hypothetical protein